MDTSGPQKGLMSSKKLSKTKYFCIEGEAKRLIMINASGNEVSGTLNMFLMSPPDTLERLLLWNTKLTHQDLGAIVESIGGEGGPLRLPRLRVSMKAI